LEGDDACFAIIRARWRDSRWRCGCVLVRPHRRRRGRGRSARRRRGAQSASCRLGSTPRPGSTAFESAVTDEEIDHASRLARNGSGTRAATHCPVLALNRPWTCRITSSRPPPRPRRQRAAHRPAALGRARPRRDQRWRAHRDLFADRAHSRRIAASAMCLPSHPTPSKIVPHYTGAGWDCVANVVGLSDRSRKAIFVPVEAVWRRPRLWVLC
jgi:hypothetical protein